MEQEINVIKLDQKTSKKGQIYLSLKTDIGNISCWKAELFNKIFAGQKYKVITESKNGYINILDISSDLGNSPANVKIIEPFKEAREEKGQLMVLSYIKDIVIASMKDGKFTMSFEDVTKVVIQAYKTLKEELR